MEAPWYLKALVVAASVLMLTMIGGIIKTTLDKYDEFTPDVFSSLLATMVVQLYFKETGVTVGV